MKIIKYLLPACLLLLSGATFAQARKTTGNATWTRTISRTIFLGDTLNTDGSKIRMENGNETLAEIFEKAIKSGRLTAYSNEDTKFTKVLTKKQIEQIFTGKIDTMTQTDPVSGQTVQRVFRIDINYSWFNNYRLLEEWVFDRQTGKTTIQMTGLGQMVAIYSEDGMFRGFQTVYWLKYNDVKKILAEFEKLHPTCNIGLAAWNDYFSEKTK